MLNWIRNMISTEDDIGDNLPDFCTYNKEAGVVIIQHRGIKGYFSRDMILQFKKENIDYIKYWVDSVDEFLDEIDEEELK